MFAGKKSAQIREILISESAWEEMTCLFAPSLDPFHPHRRFLYAVLQLLQSIKEVSAAVTHLFTEINFMRHFHNFQTQCSSQWVRCEG